MVETGVAQQQASLKHISSCYVMRRPIAAVGLSLIFIMSLTILRLKFSTYFAALADPYVLLECGK